MRKALLSIMKMMLALCLWWIDCNCIPTIPPSYTITVTGQRVQIVHKQLSQWLVALNQILPEESFGKRDMKT
ncbi:MAG: hypothetical protein SRB2_00135 [Desulfobacteraceae bacterium Eth-SRB2]|nr:MAG: hypothetical protein SRB2_00135 [Desulfobacteraceae bacterium Eth-SRB2]